MLWGWQVHLARVDIRDELALALRRVGAFSEQNDSGLCRKEVAEDGHQRVRNTRHNPSLYVQTYNRDTELGFSHRMARHGNNVGRGFS